MNRSLKTCLALSVVALSTIFAQPINLDDYESISTCSERWKPIFAHTYSGLTKAGFIVNLRKRILEGHMVRVQFSTKEYLFNVEIDDFNFRGRHICGTTTWIMSDNGTHIESESDWLPTIICTNGEVHRINYTTSAWDRQVDFSPVELDGEIWWYTKPTTPNKEPIYSQFIDGTMAKGSFSKLLKLSKWSELRVSMRDRGYMFTAVNTKIFGDGAMISAQSLNHMSTKSTQTAINFNDDVFYNWHATWATNGRRDVMRMRINDTMVHRHNSDYVALDWYGDSCWRRVYSTDQDGFLTYGSLSELIYMVKLGHRVRIHFDGYTVKANSIRVVGNLVVAQAIEEFARIGGYPAFTASFFHSRPHVVYRLIHSTGIVKTYEYFEDDFTPVNGNLPVRGEKYSMDWLVDTREWRMVLKTDPSGLETFGNKRDLEDAALTGAAMRLNIEQDELAGQFFTETDNVRLNFFNNEVYAQALKHVSDEKLQIVEEYKLQEQLFRWSLMVSSDGVVAMNARILATREKFYDAVSPTTNVTWFCML